MTCRKIQTHRSEDGTVLAYLYEFNTPLGYQDGYDRTPKGKTRWFWVSASTRYYTEGEVMIFPSKRDGEWLGSYEQPGSIGRGTTDTMQALRAFIDHHRSQTWATTLA